MDIDPEDAGVDRKNDFKDKKIKAIGGYSNQVEEK